MREAEEYTELDYYKLICFENAPIERQEYQSKTKMPNTNERPQG